jgi:hypothetical protein
MFEQSYTNTIHDEPLREGDFLYNYELRSWRLSRRIYQILGISLFINLLVIALFVQTPFLTARGCDGPLVGRVCQVLDTVYLGTVLFGTEREYADVAYDPTRLNDSDEVVFVNVTGAEEPLQYPEGYFQLANPEQYGQDQTALVPGYVAPGIPVNPTENTPPLISTPQVLPTPNQNAIEGTLPSFDNPTTPPGLRKRRGGRITPNENTTASNDANANSADNPTVATPNPANANTATPVDDSQADKNGVFINKRPLKDQAKETVAQIQAQKIKLDAPFKVIIEGTLGLAKDGKTIILKNPKLVKDPNVKNDPVMEKLVQDWILRVGDSGWLGYLDKADTKGKLKSRKVSISVEQNDTDFLASVRSEEATENEARTISSGLAFYIGAGILATSGDEQAFLKSTSIDVDGKTLVFNFKMPKPDVQELIQRKLAESQNPTGQPNSTAVIKSNNNTAAK